MAEHLPWGIAHLLSALFVLSLQDVAGRKMMVVLYKTLMVYEQ